MLWNTSAKFPTLPVKSRCQFAHWDDSWLYQILVLDAGGPGCRVSGPGSFPKLLKCTLVMLWNTSAKFPQQTIEKHKETLIEKEKIIKMLKNEVSGLYIKLQQEKLVSDMMKDQNKYLMAHLNKNAN
jgi:hypothetical protein